MGMGRNASAEEGFFLGSLGRKLVHGASATTGMKLASTGLRFLVTVFLARALGVSDFGIYAFVFASTMTLSSPVFGGMRGLLVRNTAQMHATRQWALLHGLHRRFQEVVLLATTGVGLLLVAAGLIAWKGQPTATFWAFVSAAPLPLLIGFNRFHEGFLNGLGRLVLGQGPKLVLRPVLLLAALGGILWAGIPVTPGGGLLLFGASTLCALLVYRLFDARFFPAEAAQAIPEYRTREWLHGAAPLMLTAGFSMLQEQGAVLVVGLLGTAQATGMLHAAVRLAEVTGLFHAAATIALQPTVARLYANGQTDRLQRVVTKAAWGVLGITLVVSFVLVAWGDVMLRMFGSAFSEAHLALQFLVIGHVFSVALGPSKVILMMVNRSGVSARGVLLGAVTNVTLCAALVPSWGLLGAAASTPVAILVSKVYLVVRVRRDVGIDPTVLGLVLPPRRS